MYPIKVSILLFGLFMCVPQLIADDSNSIVGTYMMDSRKLAEDITARNGDLAQKSDAEFLREVDRLEKVIDAGTKLFYVFRPDNSGFYAGSSAGNTQSVRQLVHFEYYITNDTLVITDELGLQHSIRFQLINYSYQNIVLFFDSNKIFMKKYDGNKCLSEAEIKNLINPTAPVVNTEFVSSGNQQIRGRYVMDYYGTAAEYVERSELYKDVPQANKQHVIEGTADALENSLDKIEYDFRADGTGVLTVCSKNSKTLQFVCSDTPFAYTIDGSVIHFVLNNEDSLSVEYQMINNSADRLRIKVDSSFICFERAK